MLKIVTLEPGSILGVRVELEERVEQGVGPWPESGAPEVRFSPQIHRASSEKCRHYFYVSQQLSFQWWYPRPRCPTGSTLRKKLRKYPGLNTQLGISGVFLLILYKCLVSIQRIHRVFPTGYFCGVFPELFAQCSRWPYARAAH